MDPKVVDITPQLASEMLANNFDGNRRIRSSYVSQLAQVMRDGRYFSENGQTIVVGEDDGVLYDGQHRLSAIVESGTTQRLLVVRIANGRDAYNSIDNGTRRQAADFVDMPNKNACMAVAKTMVCVEWGSAPLLSCLQGKWTAKVQVDRGLVIEYANQNKDRLVDAVRQGSSMRGAVTNGAPAAFAKFLMLVRFCDMDEMLDDFVSDFANNGCTNATVNALKMNIAKRQGGTSGNVGMKWLLGIMLDGYVHYCEGDGSTMFNKQTVRLKQYQKYVDAARISRKQES